MTTSTTTMLIRVGAMGTGFLVSPRRRHTNWGDGHDRLKAEFGNDTL
jgi:hypothetical protein